MIKKTALVLAALVSGVSTQAADLSVTLDTTYVTDYVFRGVQAGEESIQPSVEATYGDLYVGAWHSSALSNKTDLTETDLYAGYNIKIDDTFSADVGLTRYLYEGKSASDTSEAFVGIKADVALSPSLYYYYDFDLEVSTFEASVGYSVPAEAIKASLDLSAKAGNVLTHKSASEDRVYGSVGVAIPHKLAENATLTVGADYIVNDGGEFIDGEADGFVGKLGLSIGF
ncbi:MAG: TorF family putative porin [Verrucomicrobia bacterium]|nr:TorF family putative porin [Verrucomicrobiota bacterium]